MKVLPLQYFAFRIQFDDSFVQTLTASELPLNWKGDPPALRTQKVGDSWLKDRKFPILAVPSVVVPAEMNYLLNPLHEKFDQIEIKPPKPFAFDPRLMAGGE